MAGFQIASLPLGAGELGLCPVPGRAGNYPDDLATILAWAPDLVVTMITNAELASVGAQHLGPDLARAGIDWRHLPVADFAAASPALSHDWPEAAQTARRVLATGGRVLAHCFGGCGRSGMVVLRLMVDAGEPATAALTRLRHVRPCAVETEAQRDWATAPSRGETRR